MLNPLTTIDAHFKALLIGATPAGSNMYMNRFDPLNIDDDEGMHIFAYFTGDKSQGHDNGASEYNLQANYVFECLAASKDENTIIEEARQLAHSVQQVLLKNEEAYGLYYDLTYQGSKLVKQDGRSVPLAGFKLDYTLNYLSGLD